MSPAAATGETNKPAASTGTAAIEFEPPLACVRRILKNSLPSSTNVGKDASSAFARACGIFVIYITACANDFARENRRQTITANDVLAAIKELDFDEFTPQLTAFLERHRAAEKSKKDAKAKAKEGAKASAEDAGEEDAPEDDESNKAETPSPGAKKEVEEGTPASPDAAILQTDEDMEDHIDEIEDEKPNDEAKENVVVEAEQEEEEEAEPQQMEE